jgi:acyl-CoA synthetase (AMP-forming)/AMP-acid ligase II
MHIRDWAERTPDAPAIIMARSGERVTFAELEAASNRNAHQLRTLGLKRGDVFALWSSNNPGFLELAWAMQRSGLYMVPLPAKLTAPEAAYIINDSGARVTIVDAGIGAAAETFAAEHGALCPKVERVFSLRGPLPGLERWEEASAAMPATPIADESTGATLIYSSGTTGHPKGVFRPLSEAAFDGADGLELFHGHRFGVKPGDVFVNAQPLYHSGPSAMTMVEQRLGATALVFEKFDPELMLASIERHKAVRGQFVPTMFVRMLKLPQETRAGYDVSSLKAAIHSAGPCPIEAKHAMINWWGPILHEIYGGTENAGSTYIDSHEWLRKPGSVGRVMQGAAHVCNEDGDELPIGETGVIYFDGGANFTYLNDAEKSRNARNPKHPTWATFGDIGRLDEDGYLFLSDRRAFMIICGGVNIYPQEAENLLTMHPDVGDVAVFGVPDPDMGEQVKAVVAPADWSRAGSALEAELIAYCRDNLAHLKCPKSIDFEQALPRDEAGKLAKRQLRARYWGGRDITAV